MRGAGRGRGAAASLGHHTVLSAPACCLLCSALHGKEGKRLHLSSTSPAVRVDIAVPFAADGTRSKPASGGSPAGCSPLTLCPNAARRAVFEGPSRNPTAENSAMYQQDTGLHPSHRCVGALHRNSSVQPPLTAPGKAHLLLASFISQASDSPRTDKAGEQEHSPETPSPSSKNVFIILRRLLAGRGDHSQIRDVYQLAIMKVGH